MLPRPQRLLLVVAVCFAVVLGACAGDPTTAGLTNRASGEADSRTVDQTTSSSEASETATSTSSTATTATTSTTTTTTTTTTLPPLTIGFAGDTSFTHGLADRDPLGEISDLLTAPDLMVVNLETAVAENGVGTPFPKRFVFRSPPESVGLLTDAGIDVVQLANNHTLDYGRPALLRTLELLDEGGVAYVGAGPDTDTAYAPVLAEANGWTIAFVAFSRVPCDWSASGENTRPEVAWTCPVFADRAAEAVSAAAATDADLVVAMVHWGVELDHCPQQYQWDLATEWIDRGADLVIGGHPHVLQGVTRIGDGWLVMSTGNFAFPSARSASSYTATFDFTFAGDGSSELQVHPVRIKEGRPQPAAGDDRATVIGGLNRWSFGVTFDDEGSASPTDEAGACS